MRLTTFVTLALVLVPAAALAQDNGSSQRVRLQDVQTRTDEVKRELQRIHTTLAAISDRVFAEGTASKTDLALKNEMSDAYRLVKVSALLDGKPLYEKESDTLSESRDLPLFTGALPAGDHVLSLALTFKGNGYGVFKYLEGYTFNVKSTHAFTVNGTGPLTIGVTAYERGDKTTPLDLRPSVEWREAATGRTGVPLLPRGGTSNH
jgi:hypothetical protein